MKEKLIELMAGALAILSKLGELKAFADEDACKEKGWHETRGWLDSAYRDILEALELVLPVEENLALGTKSPNTPKEMETRLQYSREHGMFWAMAKLEAMAAELAHGSLETLVSRSRVNALREALLEAKESIRKAMDNWFRYTTGSDYEPNSYALGAVFNFEWRDPESL